MPDLLLPSNANKGARSSLKAACVTSYDHLTADCVGTSRSLGSLVMPLI